MSIPTNAPKERFGFWARLPFPQTLIFALVIAVATLFGLHQAHYEHARISSHSGAII